MKKNDFITKRYLENDYVNQNPDWDIKDSPWKAGKVKTLLRKHNIKPKTICEVGCGAGGVLGALKPEFNNAKLTGFDIAPHAEQFWDKLREADIGLHVGDFFVINNQSYEVVLLLDVLEHVANPHQFLIDIKPRAEYLVVHFPLDLSAFSVLREAPLLKVRHQVGHIHYYTKGLALDLMKECGYEVIDCQYTNAAYSAPQRNFKTKFFGFLRRFAYAINKDVGVRLLGGETIMVLATPKK